MAARATQYEKLLELGRGGMGTAYLARVTGTGGFERLVVVKRLHSRLLDDSDVRRRFLDEARLAATVHHANVVGVQQASTDDEGHPFLVLDYVEGASLDTLIDRVALESGTIPAPIALRIILDALRGLHAVHEARDAEGNPLQILHRDVSPQNVIVGMDGVSRVADFGIAKSATTRRTTDKAMLMGKLFYMAPEYLGQAGIVDRRLDIYAMGVTLWETLAGHDPWPEMTDAQLMAHIFNPGVPRLSSAIQVAPQVEAVVMKACERAAEDRYATAADMAADIEVIARITGWVASHDEVAELLRETVGEDIERRRKSVADWVTESRNAFSSEVTRQRDAPAPSVGTGPLAFEAASAGRKHTLWWWAAGIAAAAAAIVTGIVAVTDAPTSDTTVVNQAAPGQADTAVAATSAEPSISVVPEPSVDDSVSSPAATPGASVSATPPAAPTSSSEAVPRKPPSSQAATQAEASPKETQAAAKSPPPKATFDPPPAKARAPRRLPKKEPDGITKRNPYR